MENESHAPRPSATRRRNADYRWTQTKIIAFMEALAQSGVVADAARSVGMGRQSAYRMMARFRGTRVAANFENARRMGIRARAEASRVRLAQARSRWEGPSLADVVARERALAGIGAEPARTRNRHGDTIGPQGDRDAAQGDTRHAQGDALGPQGDAPARQGDAHSHKGTKFAPGPWSKRSMSSRPDTGQGMAERRISAPFGPGGGSGGDVGSAVRNRGESPSVVLAKESITMANNTNEGHRTGSVDDRTQVKNPATGKWVKRNREEGSGEDGQFMDVKSDGEPFKGVAREKDERRS